MFFTAFLTFERGFIFTSFFFFYLRGNGIEGIFLAIYPCGWVCVIIGD